MMTKPNTFADLLDHWTTLELSADLGVSYVTARKMRERKSVSVSHWPTLIDAARRKGIDINLDILMELRRQRVAA